MCTQEYSRILKNILEYSKMLKNIQGYSRILNLVNLGYSLHASTLETRGYGNYSQIRHGDVVKALPNHGDVVKALPNHGDASW